MKIWKSVVYSQSGCKLLTHGRFMTEKYANRKSKYKDRHSDYKRKSARVELFSLFILYKKITKPSLQCHVIAASYGMIFISVCLYLFLPFSFFPLLILVFLHSLSLSFFLPSLLPYLRFVGLVLLQ